MNKIFQKLARETDRNLCKKLSGFRPYLVLRSTTLRWMKLKDFNTPGQALQNLKIAKSILDSMGILFWIDSGTCLGAIREKNFIQGDNDIDLGIFEGDVSRAKELISRFVDEQFEVEEIKIDRISAKGFQIAFIRKGVKLDIFAYYEKNEYLWMGSFDPTGVMIPHVFNKSLFQNLKEIDFLNLKVKTPNPPEEYLKEAYGDWQVPRKNWCYFTDPPCIRTNFLDEK